MLFLRYLKRVESEIYERVYIGPFETADMAGLYAYRMNEMLRTKPGLTPSGFSITIAHANLANCVVAPIRPEHFRLVVINAHGGMTEYLVGEDEEFSDAAAAEELDRVRPPIAAVPTDSGSSWPLD